MKTQRFWVPGLVCLLTLSGGAHTATGRLSPPTRPQRPHPGDQRRDIAVGTPAPDWRLKTVEGETVALSELRGKVVVLDFWANWCGPCHKLTPLFDQLAREYQSKPVMFFTLSIWAGRDFNPQAFLKDHRMTSTFLLGTDGVAGDYGIWGVPTYFVIDRRAGFPTSTSSCLLIPKLWKEGCAMQSRRPYPKKGRSIILPSKRSQKMNSLRMFMLVLFSIVVGTSSARSVQSQQTPPLVAEAGHVVSVSRGSSAQSFQIASTILKETRRICVVLPASFAQSAPDRRYPVTIVLDGEANVPPVAAVSDELSRNGQIPESVIIAIPNTDPMGGRLHDLTPPGLSVSGSSLNEGGDRFLDFIEQELLPAVDRQFRGSPPRTFIGHSSGGILATYLAATRSTFRTVIALDTPIHLGENWLAKRLIERAGAAAATPLRYVSMEARFGWPDEAWKTLVAAAPASWKLHRERLWPKESHESIGMFGMYVGLREAFSDYSMLAAPVAPTTSILPYYTRVSAALGARVIPPRKLLQTVVEDFLSEGRGQAAREAYNTLVSGYGAPADSGSLLARIIDVERRPPPTETVEDLLATPFPTPEEARAYVGEWVGDTWMKPEQPRHGDSLLRIRVENGRVIGETIHTAAPPEYRVTRWEYLKITSNGMTWGFMNGMRPRGVVLFEGILKGDTLTGTSRFGGIDFRLPDGSFPPAHSFSFKRVGK